MMASLPVKPLAARDFAEHIGFLFLLNDDAWRDHHHEALRLTANSHVLEQTIDVRQLAKHRHALFVAAFF